MCVCACACVRVCVGLDAICSHTMCVLGVGEFKVGEFRKKDISSSSGLNHAVSFLWNNTLLFERVFITSILLRVL